MFVNFVAYPTEGAINQLNIKLLNSSLKRSATAAYIPSIGPYIFLLNWRSSLETAGLYDRENIHR
jgi:hypothetical protein